MKQIILPLLATIIFIFLIGVLTANPGKYIKTNKKNEDSTTLVKINDIEIKVEVSDTPEKRGKGLSDRASLDEGSGMLFKFDTENTIPYFWMKDMLISIDIIWIDNGKIVQIDKNINPEKNVADSKLIRYSPEVPIDYVLEVNSGFSDKHKIKIGDSVKLP